MKLLITGFEPFGGETVNPSWQAVARLPEQIGAAELVRLELPTVFARSAAVLADAVERYAPDVALCVGQAGGREGVTVEKVAINYADADCPDNAGVCPHGETLVPGGPVAYFATVPVQAMIENVRAHGLPCKISYSAGAYVCNSVLYRTLHLAAQRYPAMKVGFVHVPYSDEQLAGRDCLWPRMPLADITRAVYYAAQATVGGAGIWEETQHET